MHACMHSFSLMCRSRRHCCCCCCCCYYEMMIRCKINWNISLIPVERLWFIYCWYHSSTFGYIHTRTHTHSRMWRGQKSKRNWWKIVAWSAHAQKTTTPNAYNGWCCTIPFFCVFVWECVRVRGMDAFKLSSPSLGIPPLLPLSLSFTPAFEWYQFIISMNEMLAFAAGKCEHRITASHRRQAPIKIFPC